MPNIQWWGRFQADAGIRVLRPLYRDGEKEGTRWARTREIEPVLLGESGEIFLKWGSNETGRNHKRRIKTGENEGGFGWGGENFCDWGKGQYFNDIAALGCASF